MSEPRCTCEAPGNNGMGRCPNCWMPAQDAPLVRVVRDYNTNPPNAYEDHLRAWAEGRLPSQAGALEHAAYARGLADGIQRERARSKVGMKALYHLMSCETPDCQTCAGIAAVVAPWM